MKRYDTYKESGVQWIGEIPSHWQNGRMKFTGSFNNGLTYSPNDIVADESGFLVLRSMNIQDDRLDLNDCVFVNSAPCELLVRVGDIIICSRNGSANLVGKCAIIERELNNTTFGAFMMRYRPVNNSRYAYYLFLSATSYYKGLFSTTTINQLTKGVINVMRAVVPPCTEQQAIADWLDKKCGEIDKVIAMQHRRIGLLQELRHNIITRAVTQGINPKVSMRPSGIDWIGDIPRHWEIRKTSLIYNNIGSGTTPTSSNPDYYTEDGDGYYWLQTGDLNDGYISSTSKQVTKLAVDECRLKFFPEGSVVIAMYGATIGKVGLLKIRTATNQACCVLPQSNLVVPRFSFYLYQAAKTPMLVEAIGGGQPNISQDIIKKLRVPLPPLSEQQEIVNYIEYETAKLDATIVKAERHIALLQELRQSVITEVVTGKRKVC